jgi:hypothetical protein
MYCIQDENLQLGEWALLLWHWVCGDCLGSSCNFTDIAMVEGDIPTSACKVRETTYGVRLLTRLLLVACMGTVVTM